MRGTPCRHCGSPARMNPCWKKPRKGLCKGHEAWLADLALEATELGLPKALTLNEIIARYRWRERLAR
jgi:hypothetical protein